MISFIARRLGARRESTLTKLSFVYKLSKAQYQQINRALLVIGKIRDQKDDQHITGAMSSSGLSPSIIPLINAPLSEFATHVSVADDDAEQPSHQGAQEERNPNNPDSLNAELQRQDVMQLLGQNDPANLNIIPQNGN